MAKRRIFAALVSVELENAPACFRLKPEIRAVLLTQLAQLPDGIDLGRATVRAELLPEEGAEQ